MAFRVFPFIAFFLLLNFLEGLAFAEIIQGLKAGDTFSRCVGPHPTAIHGFKPGCKEKIIRAGQTSEMRYNAQGLRDSDYSFKPKRGWDRVLVIGSSALAGPGLAEKDAPPKQLESILLKRHKKLEVINGGVEGYFALHFASIIKNLIRAYSPTLVVFVLHLAGSANGDLINEIYAQWSQTGGVRLQKGILPFGRKLAAWNGWPLDNWENFRRITTIQSAGYRLIRTLGCSLTHFDSSDRSICLMESSIRAVRQVRQESELAGAKFIFITPTNPAPNVTVLGPDQDIPIARRFDSITPRIELLPEAAVRLLRAEGMNVEGVKLPRGEDATLPNDYHLSAVGARKLAESLAPLVEENLSILKKRAGK